ncbi:PHP domain-containing protein [Nocardioides fonticola]|uniref:PHP domain-containing protein n=1 Tax=Nocardioides fonticola TaxID=450363 RepID=A0ABP7XED2_9ACTN
MRIDLHTHSRASDGTQSPAELVEAAAAAGLDVLGLTDHDTAAGWAEAQEAADRYGVRLVPGIEISALHEGRGAHLLAYLPDPEHPALREHLDRILDGRRARLPATIARVRELGIPLTEDDVHAAAGDAVAHGRPHVADALVALGVVGDRTEAFRRYLNPGRPAYVERHAAPLVGVIEAVRSAGGVSVLAHAWGRRRDDVPDAASLAGLAQAGLVGLEVDHEDHDADQRRRLRAIARDLGLVITGSSDHHGTGKIAHELGCNTTAPEEFERLLDAVPVPPR